MPRLRRPCGESALRRDDHRAWRQGQDGGVREKAGSRMRTPLFDRRSSMRYEVMHGDEKFLVTVGFYPDGRPGEVFTHMRARRVSSAYEALARDVAILISLCLQHGEPLEDLRRVVTRDEPGAPASLAGAIIDSL